MGLGILLFSFLALYLLIVSVMLLSHIFTKRSLKKFIDTKNKREDYWNKQWIAAKNDNLFLLNKKAIKKIKKPQNLVAFFKFTEKLGKEEKQKLFELNADELVRYAGKINDSSKAYFAYALSVSGYIPANNESKYYGLLYDYLKIESVHLRQNTLRALYHMGNPQSICNAFLYLSENNKNHAEKLLSDGLIEYTQDKDLLGIYLMNSFDKYLECYQDAIVTFFFRENIHKYDEVLKGYLNKENEKIDLQCAIIRLLGKNPTYENGIFLSDMINSQNEEKYRDTVIVAAGVLGNFERNDVIFNTLVRSLFSKEWYIRINSAKSLCKMGISPEEIDGIKVKNDAYANDALQYALANENRNKEGA